MQDPDRAAEREAVADRLEKAGRHTVFIVIPLAVIAAVDLATGSLTGERRIDLVLLAAAAMSLWANVSIRRTARRIRSGESFERPGAARWISLVASSSVTLAFAVGVGYLIGGWVGAVVLPAFVIVVTAGSVAIGMRRRRRMRVERG